MRPRRAHPHDRARRIRSAVVAPRARRTRPHHERVPDTIVQPNIATNSGCAAGLAPRPPSSTRSRVQIAAIANSNDQFPLVRAGTANFRLVVATQQDLTTAPTPVVNGPVRRRRWWPLEFYRSAVGKKWVMAITGIVLLGFVLRAHGRQPEGLSRAGGDEPLQRVPCASCSCRCSAVVRVVDACASAHRRVRAAHPRRVRAHGDEPPSSAGRSTRRSATTWPPTSRHARCGGRRHRAALPRVASRRPHRRVG